MLYTYIWPYIWHTWQRQKVQKTEKCHRSVDRSIKGLYTRKEEIYIWLLCMHIHACGIYIKPNCTWQPYTCNIIHECCWMSGHLLFTAIHVVWTISILMLRTLLTVLKLMLRNLLIRPLYGDPMTIYSFMMPSFTLCQTPHTGWRTASYKTGCFSRYLGRSTVYQNNNYKGGLGTL
jgi:hypothetical protein